MATRPALPKPPHQRFLGGTHLAHEALQPLVLSQQLSMLAAQRLCLCLRFCLRLCGGAAALRRCVCRPRLAAADAQRRLYLLHRQRCRHCCIATLLCQLELHRHLLLNKSQVQLHRVAVAGHGQAAEARAHRRHACCSTSAQMSIASEALLGRAERRQGATHRRESTGQCRRAASAGPRLGRLECA